LVLRYALVFLLNMALEIPVALLVLRKACPAGRTLLACVIGNALTHPSIHFLLPLVLSTASRPLYTVVAETFVLLTETVLYLAIAMPRPRVLAVAAAAGANLLTYVVGLIFFS
jgi:hypothetical protein